MFSCHSGLFPTLEQLQLLSSLERHQVTERLMDEFLADFDHPDGVDTECNDSDEESSDTEVMDSFGALSQGTDV